MRRGARSLRESSPKKAEFVSSSGIVQRSFGHREGSPYPTSDPPRQAREIPTLKDSPRPFACDRATGPESLQSHHTRCPKPPFVYHSQPPRELKPPEHA